ncbi:MAG: transporter [Bacteroidales bacterium]|nr:transporter [Bacteroidales bacterium]MDD7725403.1 transporter [Bacteroidales bacterium]MDY4174693.1 transporter [Bacteroidales bacterium]
MSKVVDLLRNWTLPTAMVAGVLIYASFHCIDILRPLHPFVWALDSVLTPGFIFVQLFLTFCRVDPREFRIKRWHVWLLLFQLIGSTAAYFILAPVSPVLAQGAMVCLICPTATAAAVITSKLGGSAETLITYTLMINILTAAYVPLVFPLIHDHGGMEFLSAFLLILSKVFPLLIFPFLLAQLLRLLWGKAHEWMRDHSWVAFYIWGMALAMVMGKTVKSIVDDSGDALVIVSLALVSLATCAAQFMFGKVVAGHYGERISGGQAIGQKNTVMAIWMAQTYLNPLASVAPGAYVLWQNVINSYQLWKKRKKEEGKA